MHYCNRKLKDKIRTCGGLTLTGGVAAAASLAVASQVYGVPIRTQLNDHIPFGGSGSYDIDNDGHQDVFFDSMSGVHMSMVAWENDTINLGALIVTSQDPTDPDWTVKGHVFQELVDAVMGSQPLFRYLVPLVTPGGGSFGSFYETTSPRYAGFYFFGADSLRHNGWAELRVTEPQPFMYELDVIAVGYETAPETPILAGEPLAPVAVEESSWGRIKELYK